MNKITALGLAAVLLFITQSVQAKDNQLDGFYAGAGIGYAWQQIDADSQQTGFNSTVVGEASNSETRSQDLGLGQLFLGYGFSRGILYLGSEIGFNLYQNGDGFNIPNNIPGELTVTNFTGKVSPKYGFQLSLLPGIYVTPSTLVYGRVGAAMTRYDTEGGTIVNQQVSPEASDGSSSDTNWVPELIVGAGIRQQIWEKLSIRADYSYSQSAKFSGATGNITLPQGDTRKRTSDNDYQVKSNNLVMSLIYNF